MPLLFWASDQSADPQFRDAAVRHIAQLRDHIIRDDDTTFHTFFWDPATGEPLRGATAQGFADDSCWARGQAWGVYGFALNHRHTGDATLLGASVRCADYFLRHLPSDLVPYWDLVFGDGSDQPRDSSSGAILVCGLLELADELTKAGYTDGASALNDLGVESTNPHPYTVADYRDFADRILTSLIANYATKPGDGSDALALHGVYSLPDNSGVDEGNLWGDYFYLEALRRFWGIANDTPWISYW
jgi:unsaturated chondroitin disaccharide hydrolase